MDTVSSDDEFTNRYCGINIWKLNKEKEDFTHWDLTEMDTEAIILNTWKVAGCIPYNGSSHWNVKEDKLNKKEPLLENTEDEVLFLQNVSSQ